MDVLDLALIGNTSALLLDYVARQKVSGTHLNFHYVRQFPVLPPSAYKPQDLRFLVPRVLELTYTAWDLAPLAQDVWEEADEGLKEAVQAWVAGARLHPDTPPEWVEDPYPFPPSCGTRSEGPASGRSWMPTTPGSMASPASNSATSWTPRTSRSGSLRTSFPIKRRWRTPWTKGPTGSGWRRAASPGRPSGCSRRRTSSATGSTAREGWCWRPGRGFSKGIPFERKDPGPRAPVAQGPGGRRVHVLLSPYRGDVQ